MQVLNTLTSLAILIMPFSRSLGVLEPKPSSRSSARAAIAAKRRRTAFPLHEVTGSFARMLRHGTGMNELPNIDSQYLNFLLDLT